MTIEYLLSAEKSVFFVLDRLEQQTGGYCGDTVPFYYGRNGSRTGLCFPGETVPPDGPPALRYRYDEAGRLMEVWRSGTGGGADVKTASYSYYPDGLLREIAYANGVRTSLTYYGNGWLQATETVRHTAGQPDGLISRYEYEYDGDGNRTVMREWNATPAKRAADPLWAAAPEVTSYEYDRLARLTGVSYPDGRTARYTYDRAGNRLTERETVSGGPPLKDRRYTYNPLNQVTAIFDLLQPERGIRYEYDPCGNTTAKITGNLDAAGAIIPGGEQYRLEFTWDTANRLRQVFKTVPAPEGPVAQLMAEFTYDYAGRRVKKTANFLSLPGGGPVPGETRFYSFDETAVLAEFPAAAEGGFAKDRQYLYGADLLACEHEEETGAAASSFYHQDALGSTVNLSKADGSVEESYLYDAWGNYRQLDSPEFNPAPGLDANGQFDWEIYLQQLQESFSAGWNRFTYTGHEFDPETGLYYFKARFYDPDLGRFLSEDPYLGDSSTPPSLHRYFYAFGSPLRYVDMTGYLSYDLLGSKDSGKNKRFFVSAAIDAGDLKEGTINSILGNFNFQSKEDREAFLQDLIDLNPNIVTKDGNGNLIWNPAYLNNPEQSIKIPLAARYGMKKETAAQILRETGGASNYDQKRIRQLVKEVSSRVSEKALAELFLTAVAFGTTGGLGTAYLGASLTTAEMGGLVGGAGTLVKQTLHTGLDVAYGENLADAAKKRYNAREIIDNTTLGAAGGEIAGLVGPKIAIPTEPIQLQLTPPAPSTTPVLSGSQTSNTSGATSSKGPQLTRQKLTTSSGQSIKTYAGPQGEIESVFTKVEPQNLGTGTPTNQASRNLARSLGNATDDAGHGLGRNLGGPGDGASGNIFPQAPNVNRGAFNQFEQQIARRVAAGDEVYVRVVPRYAQGSTRPFEIQYQVRINGKTITRTFQNQ